MCGDVDCGDFVNDHYLVIGIDATINYVKCEHNVHISC